MPRADATPSNVVPYETFVRARAQMGSGEGGAGPPSPGPSVRGSAERTRRRGPREGDVRHARALREELRILPDVRPAKVREARRRIRTGFYERPEVLDEIIRRMLSGDFREED